MATPHVAGLAALLKSYNPSLSWLDIKNLILNNGDRIPSAEGKLVTGSRINALQALLGEELGIVLNLQVGEGGTTAPAPGMYEHEENENVTILAIPNTNFEFSQWSGDVPTGQETINPLIIQMNSSKTITANFRLLIYAPLQFEGQRVENRSLSQRESINVLNWQAHPNNSNITLYRLYEISGSNLNKLADVDSSVFTYHHRSVELNQTYSYALIAVNNAGLEGAPTYWTIYKE